VSWPYGSEECPRCRYFERLDPPAVDDAGFELVGLCGHPRIAAELFRFKTRAVAGGCPCYAPHDEGRRAGGAAPRRARGGRGGGRPEAGP
jgi:hypothetical protein